MSDADGYRVPKAALAGAAYSSPVGGTVDEKREVLNRELAKLYKQNGRLTAEEVLAYAEPERSPLHKYFTWDDAQAGHKYRLQQAMDLIRACAIVVEIKAPRKEPEHVRVRHYIPAERNSGFRERRSVLEDVGSREAFIERKKGELQAWCNSVVDIKEFAKLRAAIVGLL